MYLEKICHVAVCEMTLRAIHDRWKRWRQTRHDERDAAKALCKIAGHERTSYTMQVKDGGMFSGSYKTKRYFYCERCGVGLR